MTWGVVRWVADYRDTITVSDVILTSLGEIVHPAVCVADKPALEDRPPMSGAQAGDLARTFKVLGNDTRLRMLHALQRVGEMNVGDLAVEAGVSAQGVSNQLQRLVDRRIVAARRGGNHVFYRVVDPCVPALLELGLCLTEEAQSPASRTTS